jgi:hypothetical protein
VTTRPRGNVAADRRPEFIQQFQDTSVTARVVVRQVVDRKHLRTIKLNQLGD